MDTRVCGEVDEEGTGAYGGASLGMGGEEGRASYWKLTTSGLLLWDIECV